MKKYIILSSIIIACTTCYAQSNQIDLKSGKPITGTININVNGTWHCRGCNDSLEVVIKKGNKHYQKNGLNVNFDNLYLTINKLIVNGINIKKKFVDTIGLTILANNMNTYEGIYRDPVTENYIIISLKHIDDKNLTLTTRFPEMEPRNDNSKGTVLKKTYQFIQ
ncbi:DUF6705 family protein [Mucilaginibacter sp. McL0603]|uniref:DUF6705 family protein n=1 Tax=Mucilaginibacter sp. McL0603 TaxID=3415670 RepID=UPI003CFB9A3C